MGQGVAARPAVTLRTYRPGDETGILALHERIAGQPRSPAHWRWRYQANPAGPPLVAVAETEEGAIVGHYALVPTRAQAAGQQCHLAQVIDVMVDAAYRRGLKKPGLFIRLGLLCLESIEGRKAGHSDFRWIPYGFPVPEALRLGERLLAYTPLAPVGSLAASTEQLARRLRPTGAEAGYRVRELGGADAAVDRLWERCAGELPTAIIRDQTYLNWRYRDCPDQAYRFLLAENRFTGELEGLAVLRLGWQDRSAVAIADWLVPARADGAARALLRAVLATAEEAACRELVAWFPPQFAIHMDLIALGFRPAPSEYWLVARSFWPPVVPGEIGPTWYYTLGDSDLV